MTAMTTRSSTSSSSAPPSGSTASAAARGRREGTAASTTTTTGAATPSGAREGDSSVKKPPSQQVVHAKTTCGNEVSPVLGAGDDGTDAKMSATISDHPSPPVATTVLPPASVSLPIMCGLLRRRGSPGELFSEAVCRRYRASCVLARWMDDVVIPKMRTRGRIEKTRIEVEEDGSAIGRADSRAGAEIDAGVPPGEGVTSKSGGDSSSSSSSPLRPPPRKRLRRTAPSVEAEDADVAEESATKGQPVSSSLPGPGPGPGLPVPPPLPRRLRSVSSLRCSSAGTTLTLSDGEDHPCSSLASSPGFLRGQHWLLRSLLSPSLRVRRTACRILLEGAAASAAAAAAASSSADDAGGASASTSTGEYHMTALRDAAHSLLEATLLTGHPGPSSDDRTAADPASASIEGTTRGHAAEGGDPAVQLFALLRCAVFSPPSSTLASIAAASSEDRSASKKPEDPMSLMDTWASRRRVAAATVTAASAGEGASAGVKQREGKRRKSSPSSSPSGAKAGGEGKSKAKDGGEKSPAPAPAAGSASGWGVSGGGSGAGDSGGGGGVDRLFFRTAASMLPTGTGAASAAAAADADGGPSTRRSRRKQQQQQRLGGGPPHPPPPPPPSSAPSPEASSSAGAAAGASTGAGAGTPSAAPASSSPRSVDGVVEEEEDGVERFVASGGLRWCAASMMRLVLALGGKNQRSRSGGGTSSTTSEAKDFVERESLQLRLLLVMDLCTQLLVHTPTTSRLAGFGTGGGGKDGAKSSFPTTTKKRSGGSPGASSRVDAKDQNSSAPSPAPAPSKGVCSGGCVSSTVAALWTSDVPSIFVNGVGLTPLAVLVAVLHEFKGAAGGASSGGSSGPSSGGRGSTGGGGTTLAMITGSGGPGGGRTTFSWSTSAAVGSASSSSSGAAPGCGQNSPAGIFPAVGGVRFVRGTERLLALLGRVLDPNADLDKLTAAVAASGGGGGGPAGGDDDGGDRRHPGDRHRRRKRKRGGSGGDDDGRPETASTADRKDDGGTSTEVFFFGGTRSSSGQGGGSDDGAHAMEVEEDEMDVIEDEDDDNDDEEGDEEDEEEDDDDEDGDAEEGGEQEIDADSCCQDDQQDDDEGVVCDDDEDDSSSHDGHSVDERGEDEGEACDEEEAEDQEEDLNSDQEDLNSNQGDDDDAFSKDTTESFAHEDAAATVSGNSNSAEEEKASDVLRRRCAGSMLDMLLRSATSASTGTQSREELTFGSVLRARNGTEVATSTNVAAAEEDGDGDGVSSSAAASASGSKLASLVHSKEPSLQQRKALSPAERKMAFLRAGLLVLEAQHPPNLHHEHHQGSNSSSCSSPRQSSRHALGVLLPPQREATTLALKQAPIRSGVSASAAGGGAALFRYETHALPIRRHPSHGPPSHQQQQLAPILSYKSERSLLQSLCDIVSPPPKPCKLKVFLRRAPTQEEFFRGSLSKNPIALSTIKVVSTSDREEDKNEPRVSDLRQHIANDLQMSDSAELLELLVANKILSLNLKLKVVQSTLWRRHVLNAHGESNSQYHVSSSSGYSSDTSTSKLPPMVVTYRLAGVDGEATEDLVENLDDPREASGSSSDREKAMEEKYAITSVFAEPSYHHECGLVTLLRCIVSDVAENLRRIQRDDVFSPVTPGYSCSARRARSGRQIYPNRKKNPSRTLFLASPACPGLTLLRHCARLVSNRKKLVQVRAPSVLLRVLLDVLSTTASNRSGQEKKGGSGSCDNEQSSPTASALQELIEILATDISTTAISGDVSNEVDVLGSEGEEDVTPMEEESLILSDGQHQQSDSTNTLPLLLSSLTSSNSLISVQLQRVIADLLPFLTYGKVGPSRALAKEFLKNVDFGLFMKNKGSGLESAGDAAVDKSKMILMETLLQTVINLPPVPVCHPLRSQLLSQGFVSRVTTFLLASIPSVPPPWSPALFPKSDISIRTVPSPRKKKSDKENSESKWIEYFKRSMGITTAFKILIGIATKHCDTQNVLGQDEALIRSCHWLECTTIPKNILSALQHETQQLEETQQGDSAENVGLLAETLLDTIQDNNALVKKRVEAVRQVTKNRKRELAEETRNKALVGMSSFGPLAGSAVGKSTVISGVESAVDVATESRSASRGGGSPRRRANTSGGTTAAAGNSGASSTFTRMGLSFAELLIGRSSASAAKSNAASTSPGNAGVGTRSMRTTSATQLPSWMAEMEDLEEEDHGALTCAICQEGRKLQPTELLGLYVFVKKVTLSPGKNGANSRSNIDGSNLMLALLTATGTGVGNLPRTFVGSEVDVMYLQPAVLAAKLMQSSSYYSSLMNAISTSHLSSTAGSTSTFASSSSSSGRSSHLVTTVTAGNAIHCSCHARARQADRSHPKAPKGEWEGATLRNSRVTCNVILPLIPTASKDDTSDGVPLLAIESALSDHQSAVASILGCSSSSSSSGITLRSRDGGGGGDGMLWTGLHDLRLLLLRLSYGEPLNIESGGGSISSNALLVLHMLHMCHVLYKNAEHDSPATARHAKFLSGAYISAWEIATSSKVEGGSGAGNLLTPSLFGTAKSSVLVHRGLGDAAPMAGLCCILFAGEEEDDDSYEQGGRSGGDSSGTASFEHDHDSPSENIAWNKHRHHFLNGLLRCAGRRHAAGIDNSGCIGSGSGGRMSGCSAARSTRLAAASSLLSEWSIVDSSSNVMDVDTGAATQESTANLNDSSLPSKSVLGKHGRPKIEDYSSTLRPMIILFAILDEMSRLFSASEHMDDVSIAHRAEQLTNKIISCQKAKDLDDLMEKARIRSIDQDGILAELEKGSGSI